MKKLPHQLVQAFHSTLDVIPDADLLVHVVDGAGPDPEGHMAAVRDVINEIGGSDRPELLVFNKCDRPEFDRDLVDRFPGSVAVSAVTGDGVDELLLRVGDRLRALTRSVELVVPYDRGDVVAALHRSGEVLTETAEQGGMRLSVRLADAERGKFAEFVATGPAQEAS